MWEQVQQALNESTTRVITGLADLPPTGARFTCTSKMLRNTLMQVRGASPSARRIPISCVRWLTA